MLITKVLFNVFKKWVLVNRFIVLDFLIATIFLIGGGYFAPLLPLRNNAFKKLPLD
ncbi:hypothetical protein HPHPH30_0055 [Helicobacter pylori Hp H-30]|nr:hypothetical protein HPHPH30_0055 [Helicobacter pylori Hp H-30]